MNEIVPCIGCSHCARGHEVGFVGRELMVCTCRGDEEVTASDGCTLGTRGRPAPIAHGCEVTTGGHEAVYGYGHE